MDKLLQKLLHYLKCACNPICELPPKCALQEIIETMIILFPSFSLAFFFFFFFKYLIQDLHSPNSSR